MELNRRIKQALDPDGILNPGCGDLVCRAERQSHDTRRGDRRVVRFTSMIDSAWHCVVLIRHDSNLCLTRRRFVSSSPPPTPGPTRGRCTGRCATTTRCTTSSRSRTRPRLLRAVPARRRLGRRPRPRDVLLGAGPDRQLRRAGTDWAARQPADGDAGPTGAHRVPQAGVPRLHPAPGRGGRTQGARVRRRAHRAAARQRRRRHRHRAVQAAAVDGRRALSRRARGGPRRSSTAGPRPSSRPTPPRAASAARWRPSATRSGR